MAALKAYLSHHTSTTTDHSLDLVVDFTKGEKLENLKKNPRSKGGDQLQLYTHNWHKFQ